MCRTCMVGQPYARVQTIPIISSPNRLLLSFPRVPLPPPQLDMTEAAYFLTTVAPGVKEIKSRGRQILVEIRGDGNCFITSSVTGVLLWSVSQSGAGAIRGVLRRFEHAIRWSGATAYADLSGELQVSIYSHPLRISWIAWRCRCHMYHAVPQPFSLSYVLLKGTSSRGGMRCSCFLYFVVKVVESRVSEYQLDVLILCEHSGAQPSSTVAPTMSLKCKPVCGKLGVYMAAGRQQLKGR